MPTKPRPPNPKVPPVKRPVWLAAVALATLVLGGLLIPHAAQRRGGGDAPRSTRRRAEPAPPRRAGEDLGTWAFRPGPDTFAADALLDLRGLNEPVAGQSGFVRRSPDGDEFVLGDGRPARFWAVTTYVQRDEPARLAHHARFLAKRGVNMVRWHGQLAPKGPDSRLDAPDAQAIDQVWRLVAAMKAEGIYTTISPYWAADVKHVPASWGLGDWPADRPPNGLLFFNDRLQAAYKSWMRALLARPNPYTGIPLAKDPAVAILQLQNEDSLLFGTAGRIDGDQAALLGRKFAAWLSAKYGSLDEARRAWGGDTMRGDDFGRGVVGLRPVYDWARDLSGGRARRLDDQLQFYAETMHRFHAEMAAYLRDELGCRQLINPGNWKTLDTIRLNDAERWTYTAGDVIAVNAYFTRPHVGPERGFRIQPGDRFVDGSVLDHPRAFPIAVKQVAGYPSIVSECLWVPPNGYQAEAPFLVSAYQSLTGVDAVYWFTTNAPEWLDFDGGPLRQAARRKWTFATPMLLGQFPAAALLYRKQYVRRGEPVVEEQRSLADLWRRVPPVISEDNRYDPNRDLGDGPARAELANGVDPLAFLAGPVVTHYGVGGAAKVADLSRLIDARNRVVVSNTGELSWSYGDGVCRLDAPAAQGACGFLGRAGEIALRDVSITVRNPYASVLVVSMDGRPLRESGAILVQVGTVSRPSGWSVEPAVVHIEKTGADREGFAIRSTGGMPWLVQEAEAALVVRNASLASATGLDPNGNARATQPLEPRGGAVRLSLPRDALYVVLRARAP
jgi:hypothetical protein